MPQGGGSNEAVTKPYHQNTHNQLQVVNAKLVCATKQLRAGVGVSAPKTHSRRFSQSTHPPHSRGF
jgi:hypothetical protein